MREQKERWIKRYWTLIALVALIMLLVLGYIYAYKQNKCMQAYKDVNKIALEQIRCVSGCPLDLKRIFDSCSRACTNVSSKSLETLAIYDSASCKEQIKNIADSASHSSFADEWSNCSVTIGTSILDHLRDNSSSVPISNSCLAYIEQKYPQYIA